MDSRPSHVEGSTVELTRQLERLRGQVASAQQKLASVEADCRIAEAGLSVTAANLLVEANERLVEGMLRAQAAADTTARALLDLSQQGEHDGLTGLPNRRLLRDRLSQAVSQARRRGTEFSLLFIDLDGFKQINDTWGHGAGDLVLQFVARQLVASVRASDTVSRHGGDEFLILLHEVALPVDAVQVAHKVHEHLAVGCDVDQRHIRLAASIGISHFPEDGEDADNLIDRADRAMYEAKRARCGTFSSQGGHPAEHPALTPRRVQQAELQEANEALVLAALDAQQLLLAAGQALQRQSEFIAMVAHELRGPLAPISNASHQLSRENIDAATSRRLHAIIERQVGYLSRLVHDLFEGTRARGGKLAMASVPIDFGDVVDDAVDATLPTMTARQQQFGFSPNRRELPVLGDRQRLVQALVNLLDNASKYTPVGGDIRMDVTATGDSLVVTVSDSGIGISAEAMKTVFDPFVQETRAAAFDPSGMGLGLTVARTVVEAHGGTLVARSPGIGAGTEFTLTLPLRLGSA